MARDPDTIQRDIENARNALAESLDVLSDRASPRRLADHVQTSLRQRLADPRVKYGLIAVGVLVVAVVVRRVLR